MGDGVGLHVAGQAVQLVQGVDGSEKRFGDPIEAALRWQDAGAEWIHLVDLDAAFGRGNNSGVIRKVLKHVRGVNIELSGGIRDDASLEAALRDARAALDAGRRLKRAARLEGRILECGRVLAHPPGLADAHGAAPGRIRP